LTIVADFATALSAYSNIRAYRFDSSSVDQICIIPGGGTVACVSHVTGAGTSDIAMPNIQIQVRDASKQTAETRALAIKDLLHRGTVSNCLSVFWDGRQPDFWTDDNDLNIFSIEFNVIRSPGL
jgi:hypothetical protein